MYCELVGVVLIFNANVIGDNGVVFMYKRILRTLFGHLSDVTHCKDIYN